MNLNLCIVDDFLDAPQELRDWAIAKGFKNEVSPVDGLTYRGVCANVPWIFDHEVAIRLNFILQRGIYPYLSFVRLTVENLATRWIHIDSMYATHACVIYLSPSYPRNAGTILFEHPNFTLDGPLTPEIIKMWDDDCNIPERWDEIGRIPMKFNRVAIYPTNTFHAPAPMHGFGTNEENGRMSYTMFFNMSKET
jgi:hypothetical protein